MTILYKLWLQYNFNIIMFGNPNQCNPAEGGSQIYYDCLTSVSVRQMCPKYIRFLLGKRLCIQIENNQIITRNGVFNCITNSYRNTCYLNKTYKGINKECCESFIQEHKPTVVKNIKFQWKYI